MTWRSKAAWAYLFKDSEPIAAELWAIMGWEDAAPYVNGQLEQFSAIYARMGEPFWRTIGYFPPVLSGDGELDLAELHAASLYF